MLNNFLNIIREKGWYSVPNFIGHDIIDGMKRDLEIAYEHCRNIQIDNGVSNSDGTCHHLIGQGDSFMQCLAEYEKINLELEEFFEGKYILNSFGGNILRKDMSYANEIHRDIRTYSGEFPLMLNTLIMLDAFTPENGATWLMHEGHAWKNKPSKECFDKDAFQICGEAGTLVIWNSNLWHRAGENNTDKPRRSVTPELSRPFYKQGLDYPNIVDEPNSPYLRQLLGFNSRVPASLNDWYQPQKSRFYKDDQ